MMFHDVFEKPLIELHVPSSELELYSHGVPLYGMGRKSCRT